jgi:hypothetical protein
MHLIAGAEAAVMHATSGAAAPRPHPVRGRALPLLRHVGFICIPVLLAAAPLWSFDRDNQTEVELGALWWPPFCWRSTRRILADPVDRGRPVTAIRRTLRASP